MSALNAYIFHRVSAGMNVRRARIVGAAVFLYFGVDIVVLRLVGFSVWGTVVGTLTGPAVALR